MTHFFSNIESTPARILYNAICKPPPWWAIIRGQKSIASGTKISDRIHSSGSTRRRDKTPGLSRG